MHRTSSYLLPKLARAIKVELPYRRLAGYTSIRSSCPGGRSDGWLDKLEAPRGDHDALTSREQVRSGTSPAVQSSSPRPLIGFA